MSISMVEQIKSQQTSYKQGTRLYICRTTEGETSAEVKAYVKALVPSVWDYKSVKDIQVNPTDAGDLFFVRVDYGKGNSNTTPPTSKQTVSMSFQYHTEQMFTALDSDGWLGDGVATLPDIKGAIMMPKDKAPQGVNVQKAGLVMGLGYVVSSMPLTYTYALARKAMHVNSTSFSTPIGTLVAKEVQFVDMNFSQQPSGDFNLSLKYRIEGTQSIVVSDINGGTAMPVNPYWRFWTQDCSGADPSTMRHIAGFQSQVYPEGDLNDTLPPSGIIVH